VREPQLVWPPPPTASPPPPLADQVSKKMEEYLGEDEPTLVNFVLDKLAARTAAAEVEAEVAKVLDEEAEPFTVKLWRMLLFEIKRAKATPS